jgi:hypothetical protein
MAQQTNSNAYALLIGVNDYATFDQSRNQEGCNDLEGSLSDVHSWWSVCRAFGFAPGNIRVLASPIDRPSIGLGTGHPEALLAATGENIRRGVDWIAEKLQDRRGSKGLIAYAGHGVLAPGAGGGPAELGRLLLCPSDVRGEDLENAVSIQDIAAIIEKRLGKSPCNLTAVIDCCFSALGRDRLPAGARSLSVKRHAERSWAIDHEPLKALAERVLVACSPGETAIESDFGGRTLGAFTWAITSTLGRWAHSECTAHVSYGEAMSKARKLLEVLEIGQHPKLYGPAGVKDLAFFGLPGDPTIAKPDASYKLLQIDPDHLGFVQHTLTATTALGIQATASVVATSAVQPPSSSFQPLTEYWDLTADFLTTLSQAQTLRFEAVSRAWDASKLPHVRSRGLSSTEDFAVAPQTGQFPASGVFARQDDQDPSRGYGLSFESLGGGTYRISWFQTPVDRPQTYAVPRQGCTFSRDACAAFAGKPSLVLRYTGRVVG